MTTARALRGAFLGIAIAGYLGCAFAEDVREPAPVNQASPMALRPNETFDNNWVVRQDLPVFSNLKGEQFQAGLYQNKAKVRLAFRLANGAASGAPGVEVVLAFDPVYFFIKGSPILVDTSTGDRREVYEHPVPNEGKYLIVTVHTGWHGQEPPANNATTSPWNVRAVLVRGSTRRPSPRTRIAADISVHSVGVEALI